MDYRINVTHIDQTWSCCDYKFRVFVKDYVFSKHNYVLETLKKWFGEAEYFCGSGNETMFLCTRKRGR